MRIDRLRVPSRIESLRAPIIGALVALAVVLPSAILASSGSAVDAAIRNASGEVVGPGSGLRKLDHLIFIVQENRSFDHYFGTYPGADGFTIDRRRAGELHPRSRSSGTPPARTTRRAQEFKGGPHNQKASVRSIDGGSMQGHIAALPESGRSGASRGARRSAVPFVGPDLQPDVMSYLDRRNIPNYLALRGRVRSPRPDVRPHRRLDVAGPPVPRVRMVGRLLRPARPDVVHLERGPEDSRTAVGVRRAADLRLDRHHVAPGPGGRVVGVLRGRRDLCVPAVRRPSRREHAVHPQPPAGLHDAARDRPARPHPDPRRLPCSGSRRDPSLGEVGHPGKRERPPVLRARHRSGPGVRDAIDQRRRQERRLGVERDLPHLGRLGRVLRPRAAAEGRRRTATACAFPRWSSARSPGRATSTTRR